MKNLSSSLFLFFFPLFGWTQSLNGVYTGVLSNDSTTIRKDQSFEMALTEYKGKVYGYAYSTFIVNDTLYYIVKRVKGTVNGDLCQVEDDEVISHNFPKKPEKGVFVTYTLRRNSTDSTWKLDGNWKTNTTKKYYALTGKVDTKEEKDLSKSKLYEHLGDLNLQQTLAFNKTTPGKPEKKNVKTKPADKDIAKNNAKTNKEKEVADVASATSDKKNEAGFTKTDIKISDTKTPNATTDNQPKPIEAKDAVAADIKPADNKIQQEVVKSDIKPQEIKTGGVSSNNQVKPGEIKNDVVTDSKLNANTTQQAVVKTEAETQDTKTNGIATNSQPNSNGINNPAVTDTRLLTNKLQQTVAKADIKTQDIKTGGVTSNNQVKPGEIKNVTVTDSKSISSTTQQAIAKTPDTKVNSIATNSQPKPAEMKGGAVDRQNQSDTKAESEYIFTEPGRSNRNLKPALTKVGSRETIASETISFKSDSLVLALYDNGEIDGDTVSVFINDEVFVERQGLKSAAFKKTFYFSSEQGDSLLVVLYAENLGRYPPNTGLLIIKDGDNQHYVRFKADLDRNAAILLRKEYR